jgi:hypothetical protein
MVIGVSRHSAALQHACLAVSLGLTRSYAAVAAHPSHRLRMHVQSVQSRVPQAQADVSSSYWHVPLFTRPQAPCSTVRPWPGEIPGRATGKLRCTEALQAS